MLKHLAEVALETLVAPAARRSRRGGTLVLAYHNVVPEGEAPVGDRSLHLPRRAFAEQLDALRRSHDVVPLSALFDAGPQGRPRAVITFDDAYRGALTAGLAELTSRRLPATVFVAPGIIEDQATWWDAFANPATGEVDPSFRRAALDECRGMAAEVHAMAARESRAASAMPPWARIVGLAELTRAVEGGITVGSHSWSHANLAALGGASLEDEMARPAAWLQQHFASSYQPWLAYPYGCSSAAVEAGAQASGYRGAFLVSGGYMPGGAAPSMHLPRLNVPSGMSRSGFVVRAAGVPLR